MAKYRVSINTKAYVTGVVEVEADSIDEAEKSALQQIDDINWNIEGVDKDESPEIINVS